MGETKSFSFLPFFEASLLLGLPFFFEVEGSEVGIERDIRGRDDRGEEEEDAEGKN